MTREEEKFVWPCVGVVANVPREVGSEGERSLGKSGSSLRDELTLKGFNPTKVQPIWTCEGHCGFALVEFRTGFDGFEDALRFERSYKSDRHGKIDWEMGFHMQDDKLYGWVARKDDFNASGPVGKKLRKTRDLKSLSQVQAENDRKMDMLVENMSLEIERNILRKHELRDQLYYTSLLVENLSLHNHVLTITHEQEVEKMEMHKQTLYQQIIQDHEQAMSELETERQALEERERRIQVDEAELQETRFEREMNQKAMWEQNEANKEAVKLAAKHQEEKKKLHEKIMQMEARLNEKQELELVIESLKANMDVIRYMDGIDVDVEFMEQMNKTQIELEAREQILHEKMMALSRKERMTNDEYQDARKEMIQFWNANEDLMSGENIRVKTMGQLNPERVLLAVKKTHKGTKERAEMKAMVLCSTWEENIRDGQWHPFKVDVSDGTPKRVVKENDEKLLKLKKDYGEEVYNEVVRAKLEIEEHNASGSYATVELWNYEENRKATLEEATDVMLKIRKNRSGNKKKRKRSEFY